MSGESLEPRRWPSAPCAHPEIRLSVPGFEQVLIFRLIVKTGKGEKDLLYESSFRDIALPMELFRVATIVLSFDTVHEEDGFTDRNCC